MTRRVCVRDVSSHCCPTVGSSAPGSPSGPGAGRGGLLEFEELDFQVGDAFIAEAEVGTGSLKSFLERALLLCHLLNTALEGRVLGGELREGLAGDHLIEVSELAHELADPLSLDQDLVLAPGELGLGVQGPLAPGRFDLLVFFAGAPVVSALAVSDGLVDESAGVRVTSGPGQTAAAIAARPRLPSRCHSRLRDHGN